MTEAEKRHQAELLHFQEYLESIHGPIDWDKSATPEEVEQIKQIFLEIQKNKHKRDL